MRFARARGLEAVGRCRVYEGSIYYLTSIHMPVVRAAIAAAGFATTARPHTLRAGDGTRTPDLSERITYVSEILICASRMLA